MCPNPNEGLGFEKNALRVLVDVDPEGGGDRDEDDWASSSGDEESDEEVVRPLTFGQFDLSTASTCMLGRSIGDKWIGYKEASVPGDVASEIRSFSLDVDKCPADWIEHPVVRL